MDEVTVMVVDEQPYFRTGVLRALSKQAGFKVIECDIAADALALIDGYLPGVVLLGTDLATLSALDLGREIGQRYPNTKIIILSPSPSDEEIFEVVRSAAVACLWKGAPTDELVDTIRRAVRGEYPINDTVMTIHNFARRVLKQFQDIGSMGEGMETLTAPLTHRETEILNYVAEGNSNKHIAHILRISEQTIKNHVSAILRKLNANDRAHAVVLAIRHGWLSVEEES